MVRSSNSKSGGKKKPGDFKRPKRKVGRKIPKQLNGTNTSIRSSKIHLVSQSVCATPASEYMTERQVGLADAMVKATHYNAFVRKDALKNMKELIEKFAAPLIRTHFHQMVSVVLARMVDAEAVVREAALEVWKQLLIASEVKEWTAFIEMVLVYISSGLTHVQGGIRTDVLPFALAWIKKVSSVAMKEVHWPQISRLLENFSDVLSAKSAMQNSFSNSYKPSKKKQKKNVAGIGKSLTPRFMAVECLFELLQAAKTSTTATTKTQGINASATRSSDVVKNPMLLLYPSFVKHKAPQGNNTSNSTTAWASRAGGLVAPLLDLWLECCPTDVDSLSIELLPHMNRLVQCLNHLVGQWNVFEVKTEGNLKRIENQMFDYVYPLLPITLASSDYNDRNAWALLNISLADLRISHSILTAQESLDSAVESVVPYFVTVMDELLQCEVYRKSPLSTVVLQRLLAVTSRLLLSDILKSWSAPELAELFEKITSLVRVVKSPTSFTRRLCFGFITTCIQYKMEREKRRISSPSEWKLFLDWTVVLSEQLVLINAEFCTNNNFMATINETMKESIRVIMLVLQCSSLSNEDTYEVEAYDSVLKCFTSFFTNGFVHLNQMQLQMECVSALFHLPKIDRALLQSLSSVCKNPNVDIGIREYVVEIVFHRSSSDIDLSDFISFMMTILFHERSNNADNRRNDRRICAKVCQYLSRNALGSKLIDVLVPSLVKVSAKLQDFNNAPEIHEAFLKCLQMLLELDEGEDAKWMEPLRVPELLSLSMYTYQDDSELQKASIEVCLKSSLVVVDVFQRLLQHKTGCKKEREMSLFALKTLVCSLSLRSTIRAMKVEIESILNQFEPQDADERSILSALKTDFIVTCQ